MAISEMAYAMISKQSNLQQITLKQDITLCHDAKCMQRFRPLTRTNSPRRATMFPVASSSHPLRVSAPPREKTDCTRLFTWNWLRAIIKSLSQLVFFVFLLAQDLPKHSYGQDKPELKIGGDQDSTDKSRTVGQKRLTRPNMERDVLETKVAKLSVDLDSAKQATRNSAEAELIALGTSVIEFLPPIGTDASAEWKMRMERLRDSLEGLEMQEFTLPSTVTLSGSMSGRTALTKIAEQTGNTIQLGDAPNLNRDVVTDFDETPFWEAFDEVVDQLDLTVNGGDGETFQLIPRAVNAPLRIAAAGYSGVFRLEPLTVQKTYQLQDPARSTLQIQVLLSWEPRLVPVFVKFPLEALELICDDGQVLQSKMNAQETEFVPAGGSQLQVALNFILPERRAKKIIRWNGKVFVSIPGRPATLEFDELMTEGKKTASVGNLKVVFEKARKNRDIYEVLVGLSLNSPGQSAEAFRGWTNTHEAFLMDPQNKRIEHVGWSTTRMNDNEIGLSYLFDIEKGLEGCKLMVRAPGTVVEQTVEFALEDVPLP